MYSVNIFNIVTAYIVYCVQPVGNDGWHHFEGSFHNTKCLSCQFVMEWLCHGVFSPYSTE